LQRNTKILLHKSIEYAWISFCVMLVAAIIASMIMPPFQRTGKLNTYGDYLDVLRLSGKILVNNAVVGFFVSTLAFFGSRKAIVLFLSLSIFVWSYHFGGVIATNIYIEAVRLEFIFICLYSLVEIWAYCMLFFSIRIRSKIGAAASFLAFIIAAATEAGVILLC